MKKTLLMLMGLPRSGKSTWAMDGGLTPVVNPDSIRLAIHGKPYVAEAEKYVWAVAETMVKALFIAGHDKVILDATNTTKSRRDAWKSDNWNREIVIFKTPFATCLERAKTTNKPDLIPVIERMYEGWQGIEEDEDYKEISVIGDAPEGEYEIFKANTRNQI